MQQDYNLFGRQSFSFHILFIGPEWNDEKKRQEMEKLILLAYKPNQVYNVHSSIPLEPSKNYRIICEIHGVRYESVKQASKITKEKEETIRMKLNNNHAGYVVLKKVVQGYTPIIVNNNEYPSIQAVINANLAKDRFQVMRRLNSNHIKWENWYYKYGKKQSGPEELL